MSFVADFESRRTYDPKRGLRLVTAFDRVATGSSCCIPRRITGGDTDIEFIFYSAQRHEDKGAMSSRGLVQKFVVLDCGYTNEQKLLIKEALLADKLGWGRDHEDIAKYQVVFE